MNHLAILTRFGLTEKEARIYLDLLENGNSRVSSIANRLSLHRVEVYRLIPGLLTKGIILRSTLGKTTTYVAANPDKLETLLEDLRQGFSLILPDLQVKFAKKKMSDRIITYEGESAIERLYNDIASSVPENGTYYRYTSRTDEDRSKRESKFENYRKIRKQKQIRRFIIVSESGSKMKRSDPTRSVAIVPGRFDAFDDNFQKIIYNDTVAIVDISGNKVYAIENPELARFETKLFRFMYKFLREYA